MASITKQWGLFRHRLNLDDVTLHDLRRTCASYLAIAGENLPTIQHVLNHRSLGPTAIYARLNTKAVDRALQRQADRFTAYKRQRTTRSWPWKTGTEATWRRAWNIHSLNEPCASDQTNDLAHILTINRAGL